MPTSGPSGITHRFQWLSQSEGYVGYVLLTLPPLYSPEGFRARLACLIHTASVRSEPGSNPSNLVCLAVWRFYLQRQTLQANTLALFFQEPPLFSKIAPRAETAPPSRHPFGLRVGRARSHRTVPRGAGPTGGRADRSAPPGVVPAALAAGASLRVFRRVGERKDTFRGGEVNGLERIPSRFGAQPT